MICSLALQQRNIPSMIRRKYGSDSKWEEIVGYSRAIRVGNTIEVSGTVAVDAFNKIHGEGNAYEQTMFILDKIISFVEKAGGEKGDIVRTRIFVTDISRWEEIGRAHGEIFRDTKPVTSMIEIKSLIAREFLVEIEATAIIAE
jgi:enamine deaminase RidA (YjgF/YER057c/UK114 family)